VEITMTVPGAMDVIRDLVKSCASDVLIGAGTVLNLERRAGAWMPERNSWSARG